MISTIPYYRTYKVIADCYYIKTAKVCGTEAADIMKELVTDIIDSVLCTSCKGIRSNPYVKDAMPEQYLRKNGAQKVNLLKAIYNLVIFICFRII